MKMKSPTSSSRTCNGHGSQEAAHLRHRRLPSPQRRPAPVLVKHRNQLADLQDVFYAGQQKALLIVLQGMDTAGKDGTISHIFSGVNPQGCDVAAFKVPTPLEARHDFLWRVHAQVPPRGMIGIFNRSHYEDVLSPRVHKLISAKRHARRLDDINEFESMLADNDVVILKFFLHISRDEQTRRLQSRIDDPHKHWKLSEADFHERKFWPQYTAAYEDILRPPATSTPPGSSSPPTTSGTATSPSLMSSCDAMES